MTVLAHYSLASGPVGTSDVTTNDGIKMVALATTRC